MKTHELHTILDHVEEGLVVLNNDGTIMAFNRRAKEITGILLDSHTFHPSGKIEKGDLVVIADNRLGYDDGNLTAKDLEILSIHSPQLHAGDAFIAAGLYDDKNISGIYKNWRNKSINNTLNLSTKLKSFDIHAQIDVQNKNIDITINNETYSMNYMLSVGHMVVLDGTTGKLKFYQAKGYTIRQENVSMLLSGHSFSAKGDSSVNYAVVGKKIDQLIEYDHLIEAIYNFLKGSEKAFKDTYFEINKRPTICSLMPLNENGIQYGVLLKIIDVSELERLFKERNDLLRKMESANVFINHFSKEANLCSFKYLVGSSESMNKVKYLIYKASIINSTVLITGESGTGKSLAAKEIHHLNKKNNAPFVHVNCTAIPMHLFESELFGYEKGAFTGAEKSGKKGYFEMANGGTLFLDEIGELPLDIQVKLLHVLQNKNFYKLGATKPTNVNVRIITATNKNLENEVINKNFREDLFYRINVFPIEMPPLRDRKKDIYLLISSLLEKFSTEARLPKKSLSGEALQKLLAYDWPGNIRELENILERAFNLSDTALIHSEHLSIKNTHTPKILLKNIMEETEKTHIYNTWQANNFNSKITYETLGISKSVFYEKLSKYNLNSKK